MKKLIVLGAGESGVGAAVLGKKKGWDVFVSDKGPIKEKYRNVLSSQNISWEQEQHTQDLIFQADEVVKSPGIPDTVPMIIALREKGIPVISEIEFAGRYSKAKMIGITGSNGKTTTTSLLYHILNNAGLDVGLAGNIGKSLAMQVAENDREYFVVELSSFQLDGMYNFKCHIALLLNITPDHLDRYGYEFDNYTASKIRIGQNQQPTDHFIFCEDDEVIGKWLNEKEIQAEHHPFSLMKEVENGAWFNKHTEEIIINTKGGNFQMSIQKLALQGKHNIYNSMAAAVASRVLEIKKDDIRESLEDFQNIEHRMESVATVYGMKFVNDSKATNVNSSWWALESTAGGIVWIAGGVDKGNDYRMLEELVADKVKAIICIGLDNEKIHQAFADKVEVLLDAPTMIEAVGYAYQLGTKGDTILLSPACASFDLFDNYEDRGNQFRDAVKSL